MAARSKFLPDRVVKGWTITCKVMGQMNSSGTSTCSPEEEVTKRLDGVVLAVMFVFENVWMIAVSSIYDGRRQRINFAPLDGIFHRVPTSD